MHSCKWWSVSSKTLILVLLMVGLSCPTCAVVNIDRTRLIFAAGEMTQSLTLSNDSVTPMMLQVWTDTGDTTSSPDNSSTPVVVLPPVFKMLPGELRTLRLILSSRKDLPVDRENLYWLNIYQIPPNTKVSEEEQHKVVLPLRLRLKVLIRPAGVKTPTTEDEQKLHFTVEGKMLRIENPTPWFMSLTVTPDGQKAVGNLMVAPMSWLEVPLAAQMNAEANIHYAIITDSGNSRGYNRWTK